ncbi:hypothetical protein C2E23DRAFT_827152 [Lenzites betulinus]|nr:hypothetical protein C2E23DRAFT_827152 [Lenzites betulinus]
MAEATTHADFAHFDHSARPVPRTHTRYLHDDATRLAAGEGMAPLGPDTQRIRDGHLYTGIDPLAVRVVQVADDSEMGIAQPLTPMDSGSLAHETTQFLPGPQLRSCTIETGQTRRSRGVACTNCRSIHKRCGDGRPCIRCIQRGLQDTCIRHARTTRPPHAGYTSYAHYGHPVAPAATPSPGFPCPPWWPTGLASMIPYMQPSHGFSHCVKQRMIRDHCPRVISNNRNSPTDTSNSSRMTRVSLRTTSLGLS